MVPFLLEEDNALDTRKKDEDLAKCESSKNVRNSEEKKEECAMERQGFLSRHDDETNPHLDSS